MQESFENGRRFNEDEVKEIARKLLNILIYLHEHHPPVIHRDIKPSNILLTNRSGNSVGDIYLVDFGSVQNVLANDDGTITIVGTYGYMPMEQFSGQTVPASDIYSLGATLIYLVTGKHPSELLKKQIRITFADQVNVSNSLIEWLKSMTEPALDMRFSSAREAIASLDNPITIRQENSLNTLHKPLGSKVKITNNKHKLEIIILPRGFQLISFLQIFFTIPFLIIFILLSFTAHFFFLLFLIIIGYIITSIFLSFRQTRLRITADKIIVTQELKGGFRYFSLNILPEQITAIEHTLLAYRQGKNSTVTILPKINLCIVTIKVLLQSKKLLWLVNNV